MFGLKLRHFALVTLIGLFGASTGHADQIVNISPDGIYIPSGFDSNDDVEVMLDGYLPDACFRVSPTEVKVDSVNRVITIQAKAIHYDVPRCVAVIVPYSTVTHLGSLRAGDYKVVSPDGKFRETLSVKRASTVSIDDYLYAPVDSADIQTREDGTREFSLHGRFTNTCLGIDDVKVIDSGKTIEVLPIMKMDIQYAGGRQCQVITKSFEVTRPLPEKAAGRYLLHVRSLNGRAVDQMFEVGPKDAGDPAEPAPGR